MLTRIYATVEDGPPFGDVVAASAAHWEDVTDAWEAYVHLHDDDLPDGCVVRDLTCDCVERLTIQKVTQPCLAAS